MIVISGALVLVALILLVIGLIDPSLGFVYASIGVSLASFGFLVVGILQRRKDELPAEVELATALLPSGGSQVDVSEGFATLPPVVRKATGTAAPAVGKVLVVAGRPRYHVEGCRYLTGKEADRIDVSDARDEGFTACGVCKPDESLAASPLATGLAAADAATTEAAAVDAATTAMAPSVTETPAVASNVKTAVRPAGQAVAPPAKAGAVKAPAKVAAKAAPVKAAVTSPVKASAKAAAKAPAPKVPAKKAAAAPVKRGMVVVIPDRGKFHTPDCRYVRGAEETLELTKAAATKQGFAACGVCNP